MDSVTRLFLEALRAALQRERVDWELALSPYDWQVTIQNLDVVKVDSELNMLVIRGAIPGPKGGVVYVKSTVKNNKVKRGDAGISKNPQKASGRNPQKASARG